MVYLIIHMKRKEVTKTFMMILNWKQPFNRQIIQFEFSPTWSSSEWKLFRLDKMEVNTFQILLVDVTFYP